MPDGLLESFIALNESDELTEMFLPCENARLSAHVSRVLPSVLLPYQSEANLFIDDWLQQVYQMLARGAVFLLDYGFPRHEYYHSDRRHGTLMCHYRHRAHANPLVHVGEQDITAHVDFTHVAEAGVAAGFHVAGFTNQASFLLANGLLSFLAEIVDERERMVSSQAVKQLIQPNEMGELFKVMALTKNLDLTLQGFLLQDKRASL
jgi:SAM-dependent MidA family methyltransferase